jgi:hydrogenase maturation protein HypF
VARIADSAAVSPETTSMGRLFDAVAALCGIRAQVSYEGEAAIELEAAAGPRDGSTYHVPFVGDGGSRVLDPRGAIRAIADDVAAGVPPAVVSQRFHEGLAVATAGACVETAERHRLDLAVLSGGVFQNRLLLERTAELLTAAGLRTLVPERVPPNDGGIAYGQAAIAAARDRAGAL